MGEWKTCKKTGYQYRVNKQRLENVFYFVLGALAAITFVVFMLRFISSQNEKDINKLIDKKGMTKQQAIEAVLYE